MLTVSSPDPHERLGSPINHVDHAFVVDVETRDYRELTRTVAVRTPNACDFLEANAKTCRLSSDASWHEKKECARE